MPTFVESRNNPQSILTHSGTTYDDWEIEIARRRVFYVRGFSWFFRQTKENVTFFQDVHPDAQVCVLDNPILGDMAGWRALDLPWQDQFGWKKAWGATRKGADESLLSFTKAAMTLLLCEIYFRKRGDIDNAENVYTNMSIQPAHSYIHGFNRSAWEAMYRFHRPLADQLKRRTQQNRFDVFFDMSDGKVVTHALARRVRNFIRDHEADLHPIMIGDVDCRFTNRFTFKPSLNEQLDLDYTDPELIALEDVNVA